MLPRVLPLLLAALLTLACQPAASRRGATVLFASGADLQSINPLLTVHPLARQVQRYVLLTTLARYDSALVPRPYLARSWRWSEEDRLLTFRLHPGVRWHDGRPTTARDVVWTLTAALEPQRHGPAIGRPAPRTREVRPRHERRVVAGERDEERIALHLARQRVHGHQRVRRLEVRARRVHDRPLRPLGGHARAGRAEHEPHGRVRERTPDDG